MENSNLRFNRPHYSEILSTSYKKKKKKQAKATGRQFSKEENPNGPQILGNQLAPLVIKKHSFQSDMSLPSNQWRLSTIALQPLVNTCASHTASLPHLLFWKMQPSCQEPFLPLPQKHGRMWSCHVLSNTLSDCKWPELGPSCHPLSGWSGAGQ